MRYKNKFTGTVYLAGKMSGVPDYNYPAFHKYAALLRGLGYTVINPAENFGGRQDLPYEQYIEEAKKQVATATSIALIPGFETSVGVMNHELPLARELCLNILDAETGLPHEKELEIEAGVPPYGPIATPAPVEETEMEEAHRLINGDRQAAYSHPYDDYLKTSKMWSGLLAHKLKEDITPEEAVMMMICLKLSREQFKHKRDNIVDGHGYFGLIPKIIRRREGKE